MSISRRNAQAAVVVLAILASITGVLNGFAFDDVHIIAENERLHSLRRVVEIFVESYWPVDQGGALYRPLTSVGFAVQWGAGGGSPLVFHAVSIALYVAACLAFYEMAAAMATSRVALGAAAIFAVHPVHVEAVANIVGQAELWVGLITFAAVGWYVRIRKAGRALNAREAALLGAAYLMACGFKEHAIILPLLIGAAELTLAADKRNASAKLRTLLPVVVVLGIVAIVFVAVRTTVLGGLGAGTNELLDSQPFATRLFTMLAVVMEWMRLLFWPVSLSADYSPGRIAQVDHFTPALLPGIVVIAGATAVAWRMRNAKPVITFAVAFAGMTLLIPSNLVIVTGFVLGERTLFLTSAAMALCAAVLLDAAYRAALKEESFARYAVAAGFCLLVVGGAARSAARAPVWRDNETLFRQTVVDVPSSFRAHWMLADHLSKTGRMPEALAQMDTALVLGQPNDVRLLISGADLFNVAGRCPRATPLYRRALALAPRNVQLRANTGLCLLQLGKMNEARAFALAADPADMSDPRLHRIVALSDSLNRVRLLAEASR